MLDGVVLSIFDDIIGFVPVDYFPSNLNNNLIKNIIFRATSLIAGGVDDLALDRESLVDLREEGVIGITYMSAFYAPNVRGGQMPIILINFTTDSNRYWLYQNMTHILKKSRDIIEKIRPIWSGTEFTDASKIQEILRENYNFLNTKIFSETLFNIKCPGCSNEVVLFIPKKIENLLSIPVFNLPCGHEFEVYFTKGPTFRGTSAIKDTKSKKEDLRDIFDLFLAE